MYFVSVGEGIRLVCPAKGQQGQKQIPMCITSWTYRYQLKSNSHCKQEILHQREGNFWLDLKQEGVNHNHYQVQRYFPIEKQLPYTRLRLLTDKRDHERVQTLSTSAPIQAGTRSSCT